MLSVHVGLVVFVVEWISLFEKLVQLLQLLNFTGEDLITSVPHIEHVV
jgi:hypothetical protein